MSSENFNNLEDYINLKNEPKLNASLKNQYENLENKPLKRYFETNNTQILNFMSEIARKHGDGFVNEQDMNNAHYLMHGNESFGRKANDELKNKSLVERMSKEFTKETQQSSFTKSFAFISEYISKKEGKFDVAKFDEVKKLNLSNYVAIFIDDLTPTKQQTELGPGTKVLEELENQFEKQNLTENNKPIIFYQTNASLNEVIDKDLNKVRHNSNAIILPKQVVPKLNKTKEAAYKEIELSKILRKNEELSQYVVETLSLNEDNEPIVRAHDDETYFITISKSAFAKRIDPTKRLATFKKNNIEDNEINTKMYVLSMFHHELKDEIHNEKITPVVDFISYQDMFDSLKKTHSTDITSFEKAYNTIIEKHKEIKPTTISHNDTKWDNWFGQILGDFGYVSPGNEYKDLARSLFGEEEMLQGKISEDAINKTIDNYLLLREELDPSFKVNKDEFKTNVYEMIFTESLRLARYCTNTNKTTYVPSLMNIAKDIHEKLYKSPIQIEETMHVCKSQI